jgi:protocatechuate 4,5-dioxygenase beta chain
MTMARVAGLICTSHVPAIGRAISQKLQQDPYWKPFFDGFPPVRKWLAEIKPDLAIIFYNDHGLNFFLDKLPTFAVGAAPAYINEDEGWGIPSLGSFPGDPGWSWHIIESLVADEFDVTTCQEMLVDHAFSLPMALLWPDSVTWPVKTVPIAINTVQHPLPSARRCHALGQAVGRAIRSHPSADRVIVIGTGGLSHQLDGQRAGFINKDFDMQCLRELVSSPQALTRYSNLELVELAGTQGVEILNWLAARGALTGQVTQRHCSYHIPISNTAAAVMLLESESAAA